MIDKENVSEYYIRGGFGEEAPVKPNAG